MREAEHCRRAGHVQTKFERGPDRKSKAGKRLAELYDPWRTHENGLHKEAELAAAKQLPTARKKGAKSAPLPDRWSLPTFATGQKIDQSSAAIARKIARDAASGTTELPKIL